MKKWMVLLCALLLASITFGKATLRQTSEAQNRTTPPPEGELVYAVQEDGSVIAYLGKDGRALPVVDGSALHLSRSLVFDESDIDIDFEGTMKGNNYGPGTITITHINKERIGDVMWESASEGQMPGNATASLEINGHVAVVTITSGNISQLFVYPEMDIPTVDLVNRDTFLVDKRGKVRFSSLRETLYYDLSQEQNGHWAKYTARAAVDLGKYPLLFGVGSGSAVRGQTGSISLYAGGLPALTATVTNAEGEATSGTLAITDLKITETTVTITASISGIDPSKVRLQHRDSLSSGDWLGVISPTITQGEDGFVTYTFARPTETANFWRLYAGDSLVSLVVTIHGDLEVAGGIILTSPNGTRYRLTISDNGTLEASAL
jgi:hypothetical protein